MAMIRNPILPGFNPDPSIVRVGEDYYIATSTFEWYPGVQIHHSRDLVHWRLLTRPLRRASQLNMLGDPDSCGVWAPCLTHADGLFHLVYTDVKRYGRTTVGGASGASLRDFHNYLVTSPTIDGDWSDPVYLNSSGFDPSLFHDDDGRKYVLNQLWDHRPGRNRFAGIVLQEYSPDRRALVGHREMIFEGTAIGFTEAPHLYKRDGYYYLLTAEGGTGWGHAVTMARSRSLRGPYELHPDTYILTARHRPDAGLQRAGHADLVETPAGDTYIVYLCGRPIPNRGRCVLGRETAIQPMTWGPDGWLRTADGTGLPAIYAAGPDVPAHPFTPVPRAMTSTGRSCPRSSSGCDRPTRTSSSVCARARVICGSSAARRPAASSARPWWRAGNRRTATRRRRGWSSRRNTTSRWPDSSAITGPRSFTICTSRTTRPPGGTCG
jgi:xylan 1,4-beta-xylosidase